MSNFFDAFPQNYRVALSVFFVFFLVVNVFSLENTVFLSEDFRSMDAWKNVFFQASVRHTKFTIQKENNVCYLRAESNNSSSALFYNKPFNVYSFPYLSWEWKVSNVYKKGDLSKKDGDDSPARFHVVFEFEPDSAGFLENMKYRAAKLVYGEYPPHSSLDYLWASRKHKKRVMDNAYSARSKMVLLRQGKENLGIWLTESVNLLEDYKRFFGKNPPLFARIAIMNDSDNTAESSVSCFKNIILRSRPF